MVSIICRILFCGRSRVPQPTNVVLTRVRLNRYCSSACQRLDWKDHKSQCNTEKVKRKQFREEKKIKEAKQDSPSRPKPVVTNWRFKAGDRVEACLQVEEDVWKKGTIVVAGYKNTEGNTLPYQIEIDSQSPGVGESGGLVICPYDHDRCVRHLNEDDGLVSLATRAAAAALLPDMSSVSRDCAQCGATESSASGAPSHFKCSRCKVIFYCSKDCQKAHWRGGGHKKACSPVKVPIFYPKDRSTALTITTETVTAALTILLDPFHPLHERIAAAAYVEVASQEENMPTDICPDLALRILDLVTRRRCKDPNLDLVTDEAQGGQNPFFGVNWQRPSTVGTMNGLPLRPGCTMSHRDGHSGGRTVTLRSRVSSTFMSMMVANIHSWQLTSKYQEQVMFYTLNGSEIGAPEAKTLIGEGGLETLDFAATRIAATIRGFVLDKDVRASLASYPAKWRAERGNAPSNPLIDILRRSTDGTQPCELTREEFCAEIESYSPDACVVGNLIQGLQGLAVQCQSREQRAREQNLPEDHFDHTLLEKLYVEHAFNTIWERLTALADLTDCSGMWDIIVSTIYTGFSARFLLTMDEEYRTTGTGPDVRSAVHDILLRADAGNRGTERMRLLVVDAMHQYGWSHPLYDAARVEENRRISQQRRGMSEAGQNLPMTPSMQETASRIFGNPELREQFFRNIEDDASPAVQAVIGAIRDGSIDMDEMIQSPGGVPGCPMS